MRFTLLQLIHPNVTGAGSGTAIAAGGGEPLLTVVVVVVNAYFLGCEQHMGWRQHDRWALD